MEQQGKFQEEARQQLAAKSKLDPDQIAMDSRLADDLGLDSVDLAELGEEWGDQHNIEFDVDDILNATTVWDVVETVTSKIEDPDSPQ